MQLFKIVYLVTMVILTISAAVDPSKIQPVLTPANIRAQSAEAQALGLSKAEYDLLSSRAQALQNNMSGIIDFAFSNAFLRKLIVSDPEIKRLMDLAKIDENRLFSPEIAKLAKELTSNNSNAASTARLLQSCWALCDDALCPCIIQNPANALACVATWTKCKLGCECNSCRATALSNLDSCLANYPKWWQFLQRLACRAKYAVHMTLCNIICALAG